MADVHPIYIGPAEIFKGREKRHLLAIFIFTFKDIVNYRLVCISLNIFNSHAPTRRQPAKLRLIAHSPVAPPEMFAISTNSFNGSQPRALRASLV